MTQNTFSDIITSILYRLLNLSFKDSPLEEALRLGMTTFSAMIFYGNQILVGGLTCLSEAFDNALKTLQQSPTIASPMVTFWLLMVRSIAFSANTGTSIYEIWLSEIIQLIPMSSWDQARQILNSIMWIDVLHGSKGVVVFHNVMTSMEN